MTGGEFLLSDSKGPRELRLAWLDDDHPRAVLNTPSFHAEWTVYMPNFGPTLEDFLEQSAQLRRGETARWESIEGEIRIGAERDSLGHVSFSVTLTDSAESVATVLTIDLGQLPTTVESARRFVGRAN